MVLGNFEGLQEDFVRCGAGPGFSGRLAGCTSKKMEGCLISHALRGLL